VIKVTPSQRLSSRTPSEYFRGLSIYAAALSRLAIFEIVARLHPVAACIELHDCLAAIIWAMPAFRSTSSVL
jgi:hypothetical protein